MFLNNMKFFENITEALFLSRKNRFIVECRLNKKKEFAYLPNPGRLLELFCEGATLILSSQMTSGKYKYTVIGVKKGNIPVMLHTHVSNKIAKYLIECNRLKGFNNVKILKEEFSKGRNRFDFLIEQNGIIKALEIKTCTLFYDGIAMFPDAITERGTRHLYELAKINGTVIFLIQTKDVDYFLPEFNVDINFAKALLEVKDRIEIKAYGIKWNENFALDEDVKEVKIPWDIAERHTHDSGAYLLILYLPDDRFIPIGESLNIFFKKGYYVYTGSGKKNLSKRIDRHKKTNKNKFWHIDYLREKCDYITTFPIRTPLDIECFMAKDLLKISTWHIEDFGCSDCKCKSHLFGFLDNPLKNKKFINFFLHYRMGMLKNEIE